MTIHIFGTGGTIGIKGNSDADLVDYVDHGPFSSIGDVVADGMLDGVEADVVFREVTQVRSPDLEYAHWLELSRSITAAAALPDCEGVVVTHGTATLEETAFWLNLTVDARCPVIVVGAQRAQGVEGSDVPLNLRNAVLAAQSPQLAECGVVVAMDGELLPARTVAKHHNYRVGAFVDRSGGRLGEVRPDGAVSVYSRPTRRHTYASEFRDLDGRTAAPRVEILFPYVGCSLDHVDFWIEHGLAGLVVAAFPPALNSDAVERLLDRLRDRGIAVVLASRALGGRLVRRDDHAARGIVAADNLSPQAARILLAECVAQGIHDHNEVQRVFDEY